MIKHTRPILILHAALLLVAAHSLTTFAHESRPAYLELRQTSAELYDMLWKVPAKSPKLRLSLNVRLPDHCTPITPTRSSFAGGSIIERTTIQSKKGFANSEIYIEGLSTTLTETLIRIVHINGHSQTYRLTPSSPSVTIAATPSRLTVAKTYTTLGIQHILNGADHLLFLLCLIMVAGINRKLLITITGFTLAHSITLALAALNLIHVPTPPVEAVIALSIIFLATEIARNDRQGLTYRYPITVSLSFGFLHGLGFATVLNEIGLPQGEVPTALLFFNLGVELGQLLFIFAVLGIFLLAKKTIPFKHSNLPQKLNPIFQPCSAYVIGSIASLWMLQRVAAFYL